MVLDHVIGYVPSISDSHKRLRSLGFDEAWPIGPFWPNALTSGIALGGFNLELYEPSEGRSDAVISTLVLAPLSLEEGRDFLQQAGLEFEEKTKVEPDPKLLRLRGFPPEQCDQPQEICTNLIPVDPPFPFFLCHYTPFLRHRLSPERFVRPWGEVSGVVLRSPSPERVQSLFEGQLGDRCLQVIPGAQSEIHSILFTDGPELSSSMLEV